MTVYQPVSRGRGSGIFEGVDATDRSPNRPAPERQFRTFAERCPTTSGHDAGRLLDWFRAFADYPVLTGRADGQGWADIASDDIVAAAKMATDSGRRTFTRPSSGCVGMTASIVGSLRAADPRCRGVLR